MSEHEDYSRMAVEAQFAGTGVLIYKLVAQTAKAMAISGESIRVAFGQHGRVTVSWHWRATLELRRLPRKRKSESEFIGYMRRQKKLTGDGDSPLEALDNLLDSYREWVPVGEDPW